MTGRDDIAAKLEDAIVARLVGLMGADPMAAGAPAADIKAAPADEAGWKSRAPVACRVIWTRFTYDAPSGLGAQVQERTAEIMISWRVRQLGAAPSAYAWLDAARVILNGWTPRLADAAPRLAGKLALRRERLASIDQIAWTYEQIFTCADAVAPAREEEVLATVTRITKLNKRGGPFDPPVDVPSRSRLRGASGDPR